MSWKPSLFPLRDSDIGQNKDPLRTSAHLEMSPTQTLLAGCFMTREKRQTQEKEFRVRCQKAGRGRGHAWRNEDEDPRLTGRNGKC